MRPDPQQKSQPPDTVRLDRWLWAARFYKTRAIAADAVKKGHAYLNGVRVKPAKNVGIGDALRLRKNNAEMILIVDGLTVKRLSAPLAQQLYTESSESIEKRQLQADQRLLLNQGLRQNAGRPNKKDRRSLLKQKYHD